MNFTHQHLTGNVGERPALTPALSPGEREREESPKELANRCRVRCVFGRASNFASLLARGRAPSPGGEGRGEGGRSAQHSSPTAAFTLIELLIAVAAFAIVLAAINTVYYSAIRLRNKTTLALENALPLEHTVAILKRDLAGIVLPGGTMLGPFQTSATSNNVAGQASPNFYTSTGGIDETSPWADVQRVSYLLVNSTNRNPGQDLVRAVTRNLLPALQDQQEQQWLMTGVQTLTFLYHDGTQWRDSWDSTIANPTTGLSNSLPKAIKVQIQLVPEDNSNARGRRREPPIELVVPISAQARTNLMQQASGGTP